jgi:hypothetical protein
MPRIEIIPPDYTPDRGDGSPTIDVCLSCGYQFTEGMPLDQGDPDKLTRQFPGAVIGSTDVEHPPFEDPELGYKCECCNKPLAEEDN